MDRSKKTFFHDFRGIFYPNAYRTRIGRKVGIVGLIVLLQIPRILLADGTVDTLVSVMARMHSTQPVKIHYRETRRLELLAKPWQGSGFFYARPPAVMIKEQWYPQREIMALNGSQMLYYDPFNDVRHAAQLDTESALSVHVLAFQALLNGDLSRLKDSYRIAFQNQTGHWLITLLPRQDAELTGINKISIKGPSGQPADRMEIDLLDGDRTVYELQAAEKTRLLDQKIDHLLAELQGNV